MSSCPTLYNWKAEFDPDPRLAWLGGEEILKLTCSTKLVRKVGKRRKFFFEQLAKIDHPAVAAMMEEWSEDKRGGEIAQRYLEQRGGWTIVPEKTAKPVAKKPAAAKVAAKSAKKPPRRRSRLPRNVRSASIRIFSPSTRSTCLIPAKAQTRGSTRSCSVPQLRGRRWLGFGNSSRRLVPCLLPIDG